MEEKEQTNKHGLGSAPSARKGACDTLHSLCICRLPRMCSLRETSTKASKNANSAFPHCILLLIVRPLDCYLKPTVLLCSPLSTDSLCLLRDLPSLSTSGLAGGLAVRPFAWVSRQSRQRDSLTGAHIHTQHNEWPHSITIWSILITHCIILSRIIACVPNPYFLTPINKPLFVCYPYPVFLNVILTWSVKHGCYLCTQRTTLIYKVLC